MITFSTYNIDGNKCCYSFENPNAIKEAWYSDDCPLPANDDAVISFKIDGIPLYVNEFYDIILLLGIDEDRGV